MSAGNDRRLKIAYLCDFDPRDATLYSGGNARMLSALETHAGDVTVLPQDWGLAEPLRRAVLAAPEALSIRARWRLHLLLSRLIAQRVQRALSKEQFDVLFGAYSFHSLHRLRLPYPMVTAYSSDATPTTYKNSPIGQSFGSWFSPSRVLDPLIEAAERRTFQALDLALWPSDWLSGAVNDRYGLSPDRSLTVPWGANVPDPGVAPPTPLTPDGPVEILLVGRDWTAKGGWITAATVAALREQGVDARLTVIGCTPPPEIDRGAMTVHPHLNKAKPEELQIFDDCFRRAHFLLMPSMESYGFAFCEASAYGLPSLCLDVGGVPVWNGLNGHALPLGTDAGAFAEVISGYLQSPDTHVELRKRARELYEERLNWDSWGQTVAGLLRDAVSNLSRAAPR
ncbi:glycosyltransferase family 4 protein [Nioella aestuarii]|uniref:glycosyltransferase family 4 protein n=1 Tax=Nioella aestuarii TaxID=1662864 RepID=UPI003D7F1C45